MPYVNVNQEQYDEQRNLRDMIDGELIGTVNERRIKVNNTPEILNAQIKNVSIYYEDHGILTFGIAVDISDGTACVIGGYVLDEYNNNTKKRQCCPYSMDLIARIMKVVGVGKWEDCKGKYIRVVSNGLGRSITKIGNIMKDEWLDIPEFFKEYGIE